MSQRQAKHKFVFLSTDRYFSKKQDSCRGCKEPDKIILLGMGQSLVIVLSDYVPLVPRHAFYGRFRYKIYRMSSKKYIINRFSSVVLSHSDLLLPSCFCAGLDSRTHYCISAARVS